MNYATTIELILEDTADVKMFNLYKLRVRKVGRINELNPRDIADYLDSLESVFDADVYNQMTNDEILEDIHAYFNGTGTVHKRTDYKII
jgi:hypothetical protein